MSAINTTVTVEDRAGAGWCCQICGEPVANIEAGQVLFSDDPQGPDDFLIFHRGSCDPHAGGPDDLLCTDTLAIVVARARSGEFGWAGREFVSRCGR